jgi:hypothetical protein
VIKQIVGITGAYRFCQLLTVHLTQYCAGDKIEKNEMGGTYSADVEERGVYKVLVGKPKLKRILGRPGRRWEDNIRMDLQ